jgi:hypothetical protein
MPDLPNPLGLGRLAAVLAVGAVRVGTAPVRFAAGLVEAIVEELADAIRPQEPPPDLGVPAKAVTPSAARRRAAIREPAPPVVFPGLLDADEAADRRPAGSNGEGAGAPPVPPRSEPPPPPPPPQPAAPREEPARAPEPARLEPDEELVAETADPGAEDGAGAELHIEEPWPGYRSLSAPEVIDRLAAQDEAALSVVVLYESANRARKTVLRAAERELARRPSLRPR